MADTLLRPVRCVRCGNLRRKLFTLGNRYICGETCLGTVLAELRPDLDDVARERLRIAMLAQLER